MTNNPNRHRLYTGHISYGSALSILDNPVFITFLRDPAERVRSRYYFFKNVMSRNAHYADLPKVKEAAQQDFIDWAQSDENKTINNMQAKMISGQIHSLRNKFQRGSEIFLQASGNLSSFPFFGVTEMMKESVWLFAFVFGFKPLRRLPEYNVGIEKKELSPEEQAVLKQLLTLDNNLYGFGVKLFRSRYLDMVATLLRRYGTPSHAELGKALDDAVPKISSGLGPLLPEKYDDMVFSLIERHYERRYAARRSPFLERVEFDFNSRIDGTGWHPPVPMNGIPPIHYRITGPGLVAELDMPISPYIGDYFISFAANSQEKEVLDSLKLSINDTPVSLAQDGSTFTGKIPQSAFARNFRPFSRLSFSVAKTSRLANVHQPHSKAGDIGVSVFWIDILPEREYEERRRAYACHAKLHRTFGDRRDAERGFFRSFGVK
ncbi:MAG: hypothetical protein HQK85_11910 [Nitrospinae bacterium]|nr:hypothetical protein [Nitrospinota bacterium]